MKYNAVLTIFKKELTRFFTDRRMVLTTILLPGLMIYFLYTFMGSAITSQFEPDEAAVYTVNAVHIPETVSALCEQTNLSVQTVDEAQINALKEEITAGSTAILAIFPEGFDQNVAEYSPQSGQPAPQIEIYYNSTLTDSSMGFQTLYGVLDMYESSMINKFDINLGEDFDLATEEDSSKMFFSLMLPMLLMLFLYSGCIAVAPESIAGEKERGTMASLLVTPAKRSQIAAGKILALSLIALLSGFSSAIGTMLSFPKLAGDAEMSASIYGVREYVLLATVVLSTVLLLVCLVSIISAYAKSVKEAQTYVLPLMILCLLSGVSAMFSSQASASLWAYCIPLYNSVQAMVGIFSLTPNSLHIGISIASNLVYTFVGGFVLTRMFNSERIIYSK